ncbi:hypothetical protein DPMN_180989 [Dreissena polymorpha]|uniref:Uncharacterized protein n=1 Tax=Dreissena polymorpha TaxID=45954 RepID=A0A9D4DDK8_DREPO|nr:hypothetical protein DPMN_180989 [Dreissena polymorpha]
MEEKRLKIRELHIMSPKSTICIAGGMNLPKINWNSSTIDENSNPFSTKQLLIDTTFDTGSE